MQHEGVNPRIQSTITYEFLEKIGEGGMGEVYRARLLSTVGISETVAIKKIRASLLSAMGAEEERTDVFLRHLERETAIISELNGHPNIVGFKGADYVSGEEERKNIYIVMEYVDGMNLRGFLDLHGMTLDTMMAGQAVRMPDSFVGFILFRLANALNYAHTYDFSNGEQGIVHLDLAPGNVLINRVLGLIKLADFGIASSLGELARERPEPVVGKPSYISPEVIRRQPIDFRSDIYGLGAMAYELLTGLSPNRLPPAMRRNGKRLREEVMNWQERELIPPHQLVRGVNEELSEIVVMMLEFEKENRFFSARQLRETIGQAIYRHGYGPTDDAFSHYLAKVQILQARPPSGRRRHAGRRDFDRRVHELLGTLNADQEHLRFFPDIRRKLLLGENPCRK